MQKDQFLQHKTNHKQKTFKFYAIKDKIQPLNHINKTNANAKDEKNKENVQPYKFNETINQTEPNHMEQNLSVLNNDSSEQNLSTRSQSKKNKSKISFEPIYKSLEEVDKKYNDIFYLEQSTEKLRNIRVDYLEDNPKFDEKKRIILLDWIMDVCYNLGFKRETYYLAELITDIYFSKSKNIEVSQFQLIGVSALVLASKVEEVMTYDLTFFSKVCDDACSTNEIKDFQLTILSTLNYKINYPTLSTWANLISYYWDIYSSESCNVKLPKFRQNNCPNFFDIFIILDIISLDYIHIFLNEKYIAATVIFFILCICLKIYSPKDIECFNFNYVNNYQFRCFSDYFTGFLKNFFEYNDNEFWYTAKYVSDFFGTKISFNKEKRNGITVEDYLQYQNHNTLNSECMKEILEKREQRSLDDNCQM